jgi:hypothetical protein
MPGASLDDRRSLRGVWREAGVECWAFGVPPAAACNPVLADEAEQSRFERQETFFPLASYPVVELPKYCSVEVQQ